MVRRPKWLANSTSWGSSPGCSVRMMLEEGEEEVLVVVVVED